MVDLSRRAFFHGRPRPKAELRPPWALQEALFIDQCTRCNDCITTCPQRILIIGDGGYPTVDFSQGECILWRLCIGVPNHGLDPPDARTGGLALQSHHR